MTLLSVLALFALLFGATAFGRARAASKNAWGWAVGTGIACFLISWIAVWLTGVITRAIGFAFFPQVATQLLVSYLVAVWAAGVVFEKMAGNYLR